MTFPLWTFETAALVFTVAGCVLMIRRSPWNWPPTLIGTALYAAIFFSQQIYAYAVLGAIEFVIGCVGWLLWLGGRKVDGRVAVARLAVKGMIITVFAAVLLAGTIYVLLVYINGKVPLLDAISTSLGLVARVLFCGRRIESWLLWMAVNVVCIVMFVSSGLFLTAATNVGFFAMCVVGYREWRKSLALISSDEVSPGSTKALVSVLPAA